MVNPYVVFVNWRQPRTNTTNVQIDELRPLSEIHKEWKNDSEYSVD